jgi:hypothetical protein
MIHFFDFRYPYPEVNIYRMAYNELGYTTLSVAEPRRGVSVGATSCRARSVTEDNVPLGRARASPERSVSAAVIRRRKEFTQIQFSNFKFGTLINSFVLFETRIKFLEIAWAAI